MSEVDKDMNRKLQTVAQPPVQSKSANDAPSTIRHASNDQFAKAQQKTSTIHAGLFRRLAK